MMAHPWPPNDPERADWDRRAEAYQARIDTLTNELATASAEALSAKQAREVAEHEAEVAKDQAHEADVKAAKLRIALEHYAAPVSDSGKTARRALEWLDQQ